MRPLPLTFRAVLQNEEVPFTPSGTGFCNRAGPRSVHLMTAFVDLAVACLVAGLGMLRVQTVEAINVSSSGHTYR